MLKNIESLEKIQQQGFDSNRDLNWTSLTLRVQGRGKREEEKGVEEEEEKSKLTENR